MEAIPSAHAGPQGQRAGLRKGQPPLGPPLRAEQEQEARRENEGRERKILDKHAGTCEIGDRVTKEDRFDLLAGLCMMAFLAVLWLKGAA